jgi:hypothetical protein
MIGWRVIAACFSRGKKLPSRIRFLGTFAKHLFRLRSKHGDVFVVKYLKASQLAVQKCIAGEPLSSLKEVGGELPFPRLSNGLPVIIPVYDRRLIRIGSASIIRYWLTLFSLYRIIKVPGQLKLSTITDPASCDLQGVEFIGINLEGLTRKFFSDKFRLTGISKGLLLLETGSPQGNPS